MVDSVDYKPKMTIFALAGDTGNTLVRVPATNATRCLPSIEIADHTAAGRAGQLRPPEDLAGLGIERIGVFVHVAGEHEAALGRRDARQHRRAGVKAPFDAARCPHRWP